MMNEDTYSWIGWTEETEFDDDDARKDVHFLTITENGEEYAVIIHRTVGGKYPINGEIATAKLRRAARICDALNAYMEKGA